MGTVNRQEVLCVCVAPGVRGWFDIITMEPGLDDVWFGEFERRLSGFRTINFVVSLAKVDGVVWTLET